MTAALNFCWHLSPDAAAQARALAGAVALQLRQAVARRGQALLAVSGGRSPRAFLQALSGQALPWSQVTVLLTDERCVPAHHPDSNARLVRKHLLQGQAAAARWLPFFQALPAAWREPADPARQQAAAEHLEASELQALAEQAQARLGRAPWPLDVLVLGMGEDGHTASLFARADGLAQALHGPARVAWVRPVTAPHARLTLTLPVLQQASHAHLVLAGAAKRQALDRAMAQASDELTVSQVLRRPGTALQIWCAL